MARTIINKFSEKFQINPADRLVKFGNNWIHSFSLSLSTGKRACEPPEYRWSTLPKDTRGYGVSSLTVRYQLLGRNRISDGGKRGRIERGRDDGGRLRGSRGEWATFFLTDWVKCNGGKC
ncbi:hypothetical protein EVAR_66973_1 [Eumeta japonica]|uniref:Uncharacterized protein n=1 Tax=Eumeta variegata TaxID=151549 RepID=A0A4C1ZWM0_EUMVA|nr:hypothetical protein EVAR_66973_1 [Eumeta japonica]